MSRRTPVIWKGAVVGVIEDVKAETFNWYGKWFPSDTDMTGEFISALRSGNELEVQLGFESLEGTWIVETEPDDEIDLRYKPSNPK